MTRIKAAKISAGFFVAVLMWHSSAYSDMIYFKNGGTVEGTVQKDDGASLIIDLGVGTMTVRKDEVERIEKASDEDNQKLADKKRTGEISRGERAPLGGEEIRMAYLKAKDDRESLKKSRNNGVTGRDEISQKEKRVSELLKTLDAKSKELKTIDAEKHTKEYNNMVAEMNSISAQLNTGNSELKNLYAEQKKIDAALMQKANTYRTNFQVFKDALKKKQGSIDSTEISADEASFFAEMSNRAVEMDNDFKKEIVGYTPEANQIVVDAVINDNVSVRLVVDTGASIVILSKEVAGRLGITEENTDAEIEITMANGATVNAQPVILKSIKVGDAEIENVEAAILENNLIGGADGLLGMSFLNNFIVSVDTSSSKLILEQVL